MVRLSPYLKAVTAALIAGGAVLATKLADDESFSDLGASDWLAAGLALLVALGAVWAVPNPP